MVAGTMVIAMSEFEQGVYAYYSDTDMARSKLINRLDQQLQDLEDKGEVDSQTYHALRDEFDRLVSEMVREFEQSFDDEDVCRLVARNWESW